MVSVRDEFQGTSRFAIRRRLGAGGMGVVYHAYDRQLGVDVALKTLKHLDPGSLYHFKREFRALTDVSHPNLVSLFELISEGEQWFFTMELVRGSTFYDYVCAPAGLDKALSTIDFKDRSSFARVFASEPEADGSLVEGEDDTEILETLRRRQGQLGHEVTISTTVGSRLADEETPSPSHERLRATLQQLTQGLQAIHGSGKLHRDLKPSNVLVTRAGRVVILDFGLIADIEGENSQFLTSTQHGLAGTFAYMAPEQGSNRGLSPAADWYSVGVMLYEALTGALPFPETGLDVLLRKQREEPPPPAALMGGVPPELNQLCVDLLRINPEERPSGEQVWDRLASPSETTATGVRVPRSLLADEHPFIGRTKHLAALEAGFAVSRSERAVAMLVRGSSGMGKTVLMRKFLEELHSKDEAVILAGRCYERESVPYKALDSLIDSLSRYLAKLPKHEAAALLPRGIAALARVFPVLSRVPAVAESHRLPALTPDIQELRRRAFSALKELLARLTDRTSVVIYIDDLQWGDADSAHLLAELLRPPDAPRLFFIGCYRSEDEATSPILQEIHKLKSAISNFKTLTVGALSTEESNDLALTLLGIEDERAWGLARRIGEEGGGNPFFIDALARHVRTSRHQDTELNIRLESVLLAQFKELSEDAQRLMEVVSVAGRPFPAEIAIWAARLGPLDESNVFDQLRSRRFLRTSRVDDHRSLECAHDRIRTALLGQITPDRLREHHQMLASAFRERPRQDVEAIFHHSFEAGDVPTAVEYAEKAGDQAFQALAFGRAAALYRIALDLATEPGPRLLKLGTALAHGGRCAEAAEIFLSAAEQSQGLEQIELRRKAGEQLLIGGQVDQGIEILHHVLDELGLRIPKTSTGAFASFALTSAQLWTKGFSFQRREESEIPPEDLLRVDTLYTIASGIGLIDPLLGLETEQRHLLTALKIGEPVRVARAIALSASFAGSPGSKGKDRAEDLRREAKRLAHEVQDPRMQAFAVMADGVIDFLNGQWAPARKKLEQAEVAFRDTCVGAVWELTTTRWLLNAALFYLGDLRGLSGRVLKQMDDADLRGALFEGASLRMGYSNTVFLVRDNPERSLRVIDEGIRRWSHASFHLQHYLARSSLAHAHMYAGRGDKALAILDETWPAVRDSKLMLAQYLRIDAGFLRSKVLVSAAARVQKGQASLLAEALRFNEKIAGETTKWVRPLVELIRGLVASFDDKKTAIAHFEKALSGFEALNMALYAHATRYRLGTLEGGKQGFAKQQIAAGYFANEGVRNMNRFLSVFAPGKF